MKFQSTIVAAVLCAAGMSTVGAFAPSAAVQSRQKAEVGNNVLNMVATSEIVNGEQIVNAEQKPRKTREVSLGSCFLLIYPAYYKV